MDEFPQRAAPAFLILWVPFLALSIWLMRASGFQSMSAFLASLLLPMLVVAVLARTWRRFFLLHYPIVLLSAAFATYVITYGEAPGDFMSYVLATSSWQELRGFFTIWQGQRLILGAVALTGVYLALAFWCPPSPIFSAGSRTRLVVLGVVAVLGAIAAPRPVALLTGINMNPVVGTTMFIEGPLSHAHAAVNGTAVIKVPYHASSHNTEEVHILVVGESARRDSWSVYGYGRNTTPYLEKIRPEAVFFQNARADANFTIYAVPILLTGMTPARFSMSAIKGSLLDLAEESGYSTSWMMNQDSHISLLIGIHADRMVYPPLISTLVSGGLPLDERLLPDVRQEIARSGKARFIGIHSIGSHWPYSSRYPSGFERFGSKEPVTFKMAYTPDPGVLNAYDDTIAYTDWLLEQVIEAARKLTVPATVTYYADHGEDLYALDGNAGHGTPTYDKHQFEVPAFIWMNAAYRAAHPDKVQAITANSDKAIRSHNLFDSLADIMGIQWPGARASESFASPDFVPDTQGQYIAGGKLLSAAE
jgi:glucan phosphoethanolaminetransferase (alkaline phosphatase superfamily)